MHDWQGPKVFKCFTCCCVFFYSVEVRAVLVTRHVSVSSTISTVMKSARFGFSALSYSLNFDSISG